MDARLEPRLTPDGTIEPGPFNAPWVNALRGEARGVEVVVRRDAADGFSGWAGYALRPAAVHGQADRGAVLG